MPSNDFWADLPSKEPPRPDRAREPSPGPKPPPAAATNRQPPAGQPSLPARLGKILGAISLILTGAGIGLGLWLVQGMNAQASDLAEETEPVVIEISRGTGVQAIAQRLEDEGLIVSRWPLIAYIVLRRSTLKAGVYTVSPDQTTRVIADQLAGGRATEHVVTIPEGWRIEQIADLLDKATIVSRAEFLKAARYEPVRDTLPPGIVLEPGRPLEGLLFPDTYRFAYGVTSKEIVSSLLDNFTRRTKDLELSYAQVSLASIVEREAKFDADRAGIAGVYQNRLKNNLKLEADPTVQFGRDTLAAEVTDDPTTLTWWGAITSEDYQRVKSPWNTYLMTGLPPTPIANPGLASLKAAVHPADHRFFYFFHRPDGTTVFSATKEEHDRKIQE